jgi:pimeloyl-ACP methyl ester carboxylesterase
VRRVSLLLLAFLLFALVGGACRDGGDSRSQNSDGAAGQPARSAAVKIGNVTADLFGTSSPHAVVIVSPPDERAAWQQVAASLATTGYSVLLYSRPDRDADATARRAGELLRGRGVEKVVFVGSRAGAADALSAARDDGAGVAILNPLAPPEPIPSAGMPLSALLAMASLADGTSSALARRVYEAAPEPRTLALYPARLSSPAVLTDPSTPEVRDVFMEFLRSAFESQSA